MSHLSLSEAWTAYKSPTGYDYRQRKQVFRDGWITGAMRMIELAKNRGSESEQHLVFLLDVLDDMEREIKELV